jgi:TRAP-type mannitol/chloroaromatic compound transport system permease small subunit
MVMRLFDRIHSGQAVAPMQCSEKDQGDETGMRARMARIAFGLRRVNEALGRCLAWLAFGVVLLCFACVVLRYGFNSGAVWLQEAYVWLNAFMFLLGAGWLLGRDGHVRVDIFYSRLSLRARCWIDMGGVLLLLLPWLAVIAVQSWPFIVQSWAVGEWSNQAGGLPGYFLLKSSLLLFCFWLAVQGLALALERGLYLCGDARFAPAVEQA